MNQIDLVRDMVQWRFLLNKKISIFGSYKKRRNSWLAQRLKASKEGHCFTGLVTSSNKDIPEQAVSQKHGSKVKRCDGSVAHNRENFLTDKLELFLDLFSQNSVETN